VSGEEASEEASPSASWSGSEDDEGGRKKTKGASGRKQPPAKKAKLVNTTRIHIEKKIFPT
jgi:hypothetical protein